MSVKAYVDGMLADWGSRIFNGSPVIVTSTKKGMTGFPVRQHTSTKGGAIKQSGDAKAIRSKLGSIARRTPEVLVRISGGGKGMKHVKAHLDYISRNGQLEAEDQNGDRLNGKEEIDGLRYEWQNGGFPIPEESGSRREAFNIVLSMPAGTNELAVKRAARDFAASEFGNHQYVMVLHTFETDPDPVPSPNPHVHLAVKAMGLDGTRLNPRKEDLQRWREKFAEALRQNGVEAAATKRIHRLHLERGEKRGVREKKGRGENLDKIGRSQASSERVTKAKEQEKRVLRSYREIATVLAKSEDVEDRKLAAGLVRRLSESQQKEPVLRDQSKDLER